MHITPGGLDLAKNGFRVHGITERGEVAFNRALRRAQTLAFFERLEPCLDGMEASSTGHYRARELTKPRHEVRLILPVCVKPYVKRRQSDAAALVRVLISATYAAAFFLSSMVGTELRSIVALALTASSCISSGRLTIMKKFV